MRGFLEQVRMKVVTLTCLALCVMFAPNVNASCYKSGYSYYCNDPSDQVVVDRYIYTYDYQHPKYTALYHYQYDYKYLAHHMKDPRYFTLMGQYDSQINRSQSLTNRINAINGPLYNTTLTEANDELKTIQFEEYPPAKEDADVLLNDATAMDNEHEQKRQKWESHIVEDVKAEIENWIEKFHTESDQEWGRLARGAFLLTEQVKVGDRYFLAAPEKVGQVTYEQSEEDVYNCFYGKKAIFVPSGSKQPKFETTDQIRAAKAVCVEIY